MKLTVFLFFLFFCQLGFSQDLSGVWQGVYTTNQRPGHKTRIVLVFTLNPDSTYKIFSYTRFIDEIGIDTVLVCAVNLRKTKKHFVLEEQELQTEPSKNFTMQKMFVKLKVVGKEEKLIGSWRDDHQLIPGSGGIEFIKIASALDKN